MSEVNILDFKLIVCPRIDKLCIYAYELSDTKEILCSVHGHVDVYVAKCSRRHTAERSKVYSLI